MSLILKHKKQEIQKLLSSLPQFDQECGFLQVQSKFQLELKPQDSKEKFKIPYWLIAEVCWGILQFVGLHVKPQTKSSALSATHSLTLSKDFYQL